MKKNSAILTILLATAIHGFAQDTITGVVSRVAAPYFEQNACDSRFAIMAESGTYYVMVDNYWPNPYLEDLVIHYDTFPIGNEIEVVGNILELEDGNGNAFQTIDISKSLSSDFREILGFYYYYDVAYPGPDTISAAYFYDYSSFNGYCLTINEALQAANPFVINGRTLVQGKRYLFIGKINSWIDYNGNPFNVLELADALPYDKEDLSVNGVLTKENDLCLSSPCSEKRFLSLFDGEEHKCLTNKRMPTTNYINDAVFMEGDSVTVGGFEFICHDIFGAPFTAFEFIKVHSYVQHLLIGGVGSAPMPYIGIGPPLPGIEMAFYSDNIDYYLRNPNNGDGFNGFYVVGNDTIHATAQQLKATLVAGVFIDNYFYPCYTAYINNVEFEEHEETLECTLAITSNPFYWGDMLAVYTQNDETYYLKPYIYEYTAPDHIIIGNHMVYVGDSFNATGRVSYWYHNNEILEKVIDITEISSVTGLADEALSDIQIHHNNATGMIQIVSKQPMKTITIYDNTGRLLLSRPCYSPNQTLDLKEYKGVVVIYIALHDGHKTIIKEIFR